jgi:hypothetical protein
VNLDDPTDVLRVLYGEMVRRRPVIDHASRYYDGDHRLAFASEKFLDAFGGLFGAFADNWCALVVDAVEERLQVQGFRVGKEVEADSAAKKIWEENELDLQSAMGHTDGLVAGAFYVTAWQRGDAGSPDEKVPEITVESAATAIVLAHPKMRRRRTAGLRVWTDEEGYEHAELFRPDRVYLFRSRAKRTGAIVDPFRVQWIAETHADLAPKLDESSSMVNPLGKIPMVEFLNRPRLTLSRRVGWAAHSELSAVIPINDAANKLLADMIVASEFAAFPQRHVTGWEPDTDEETDEIIEPNFRSGPGKTWWTENHEAKFGAFPAVSVDQYVKAIELLVQHIASVSSTPPHYLRASADRLSGESLKSAETGLVAKVRRKQRHFGAGWEEVIRIAGEIAGNNELANALQMETIWRDPETRTESEHVDAVAKKKDLDVPAEQLWEELGYSPEQIARFPAMRARNTLAGSAALAEIRNPQTPRPPAPGPRPPTAPVPAPVPAAPAPPNPAEV